MSELVRGRHMEGRRFSPDARDQRYPMRKAMRPVAIEPRIWQIGPTLDQGQTPQCVAYSIAHWLACTPITTIVETPAYEQALYDRAQQIDEWPGTDYEGTSVRAGFQVLEEQGRLGSYVWAQSEQDIWDFICTTAPVEMGSLWYSDMWDPDANGFLRPTGSVVGGHAWLAYGTHADDFYWMQNSWSAAWSVGGTAKIARRDMEWLLQQEGEAGAGTEQVIDPVEPEKKGCLARLLGLG